MTRTITDMSLANIDLKQDTNTAILTPTSRWASRAGIHAFDPDEDFRGLKMQESALVRRAIKTLGLSTSGLREAYSSFCRAAMAMLSNALKC